MRKLLVLVGIGLITLSALFFYAEHNRQGTEREGTIKAMQDVLKGQNLALAGRIFDGLSRADQDAMLAFHRWKKKAKMRSFLSDTAFSEPDAPKWMIVAGRRVRAAGVVDDALLEDALENHLRSPDRLAVYHSKGKYYLFINGKADGQEYSSAYSPEAFFAAFRSADGVRAWLALRDGTVVYHPLGRFIGSNASNLKPVAAGIKELNAGSSAPFARTYLGIDGRDTLGSWTPLPSFGLLVGSEWPRAPEATSQASAYFWLGLACATLASLFFGWAMRGRRETVPAERLFDENRLDDDAMEYLENARRSAVVAQELLREKDGELDRAIHARDEAVHFAGALEGKITLLESFLRILPGTGKQVWAEICELIVSRAAGFSLIFYRYSPSSFSLVPESIHGGSELPESAVGFLRDTRIYLGSPAYLGTFLSTDAFQKWDMRRRPQMPFHQSEFRAYPIQCAGFKGAVLACFDERMNLNGEIEGSLKLLESLLDTAATFCEAQSQLVQSSYAKGSSRPVESAPDDARSRPRPS